MNAPHPQPRTLVALAAALLTFSLAASAPAQPGEKPRSPSQQSQRKSPIDLENQAKERRQGQVLPGDPVRGQAPAPAAPTAPAVSRPITPADPELPVALEALPGEPAHVIDAPPSTLRAVPAAPTPEAGVVPNPPPASGYAPARVRVADTGMAGDQAQWRASVGGWQPLTEGQTTEARVEVRAGLESDVVLIVDDNIEVRVGRLARVAIEKATEPDGSTTVSLVVARGMIEVRPLPGARPVTASRLLARVRTPDRSLALTAPAELTYDAFSGTRVRLAGVSN